MSWGTKKWNLTGSSSLFDYGYFCPIWYNECTASSPTSWIACLHSGQHAGLDGHHTDTVLPLGILLNYCKKKKRRNREIKQYKYRTYQKSIRVDEFPVEVICLTLNRKKSSEDMHPWTVDIKFHSDLIYLEFEVWG